MEERRKWETRWDGHDRERASDSDGEMSEQEKQRGWWDREMSATEREGWISCSDEEEVTEDGRPLPPLEERGGKDLPPKELDLKKNQTQKLNLKSGRKRNHFSRRPPPIRCCRCKKKSTMSPQDLPYKTTRKSVGASRWPPSENPSVERVRV